MSWALVNMGFSLPLYAHAFGRPWSPDFEGVYAVVLMVCGIGAEPIHERRVHKMVGPAASSSRFSAPAFWGPVLLTGIVTSVYLASAEGHGLIFALWPGLVGLGYLVWGAGFRIREYELLGALLLTAFVCLAALQGEAYATREPSVFAVHIWNASMGACCLARGVAVNRRYLWGPAV